MEKKAWRKQHKNVASNIEWILETAAVRPPITHHENFDEIWWTRHAGHCWRSREELIRDVLLWTPWHGRAKAGRPARLYTQQLCGVRDVAVRTCRKQWTIGRGGERGSGISVLITRHGDDDDGICLAQPKLTPHFLWLVR